MKKFRKSNTRREHDLRIQKAVREMAIQRNILLLF